MIQFAQGICCSTSKCCSADTVLETLKKFSETWLFWGFRAQVSWHVFCVPLKTSSSLGTERGLYKSLECWNSERCTTSSSGSSISTTIKCWWKMPLISLCSLTYWEMFLFPTQTFEFWFPVPQFSSEMQAAFALRKNSDQQQIYTENSCF